MEAQTGGLAEVRRQTLEFRKLRCLGFAGQSSREEEAKHRKSLKNLHSGF